jgi:hypothetical protein
MKSKSSRLLNSFPGIIIGTILFILVGCNNQHADQGGMDNGQINNADSNKMVTWLGFKVEFKPNTSAEMRDRSIRAIESVIMDSAKILKLKYPAFSPTICIGKSLFLDTLTYSVKTMSNRSVSAYIKDTTCTCKSQCGVCQSILNSTNAPIGPGDPFLNIKRISDLE